MDMQTASEAVVCLLAFHKISINLLVGEGPKSTTPRKECLSHYRSEYSRPKLVQDPNNALQ
jgi:hypothetical protein